MPYYLYKITDSPGINLVKNLELISSFKAFREAKLQARALRAETPEDGFQYKIVFADSELHAEELLMEKREQPVLMEHER